MAWQPSQQEIIIWMWTRTSDLLTYTRKESCGCPDQIRMNAKWRKMDLNHLLQFHYNAMRSVASVIFIDFCRRRRFLCLLHRTYLRCSLHKNLLQRNILGDTSKYRSFNDDHIHIYIYICEGTRTLERLHSYMKLKESVEENKLGSIQKSCPD